MEKHVKTSDIKPKRNKKGQLLPGETANPNGRPPGVSITDAIKRKLEEIPEGQQKSYLELLISRILKQAVVDGDGPMIKNIWNYIDGMPRQGLDIKHDLKDILTQEQIDELFLRRTKKDNAGGKA